MLLPAADPATWQSPPVAAPCRFSPNLALSRRSVAVTSALASAGCNGRLLDLPQQGACSNRSCFGKVGRTCVGELKRLRSMVARSTLPKRPAATSSCRPGSSPLTAAEPWPLSWPRNCADPWSAGQRAAAGRAHTRRPADNRRRHCWSEPRSHLAKAAMAGAGNTAANDRTLDGRAHAKAGLKARSVAPGPVAVTGPAGGHNAIGRQGFVRPPEQMGRVGWRNAPVVGDDGCHGGQRHHSRGRL